MIWLVKEVRLIWSCISPWNQLVGSKGTASTNLLLALVSSSIRLVLSCIVDPITFFPVKPLMASHRTINRISILCRPIIAPCWHCCILLWKVYMNEHCIQQSAYSRKSTRQYLWLQVESWSRWSIRSMSQFSIDQQAKRFRESEWLRCSIGTNAFSKWTCIQQSTMRWSAGSRHHHSKQFTQEVEEIAINREYEIWDINDWNTHSKWIELTLSLLP